MGEEIRLLVTRRDIKRLSDAFSMEGGKEEFLEQKRREAVRFNPPKTESKHTTLAEVLYMDEEGLRQMLPVGLALACLPLMLGAKRLLEERL